MICTNMNKPSAKIIFFAASMYYSERLIQELKERLSKNLMKYSVNNWFAVVDDDNFVPQLGFPKDFWSISFSLIENALCSDIICSRIAIGRDPPDGTIPVSAYNKILFFHLFYFSTMAREKRTNHLGPKNKASYCETKW